MTEWKQDNNFLTSFTHAVRGAVEGYTRERNIRIQVWIFSAIILLALALRVTFFEFSLVVLVSAFVISLEMVNTALEGIEDVLSPEYREAIRRSKDIAAGAVLVAGLAAIIIGGIVFLPYITNLLY